MNDTERSLVTQLRYVSLPTPVPEYLFAKDIGRRWRFDFAWPNANVACEIEGGTWIGGRHTTGTGYEKDLEKYNRAALMGWTVLRFTPAMVDDGRAIDMLLEALR